ncbi:borealin [Pseudomyrmex gracilis]|uniref:borealin n=1 Tax=Pseudomyrmex gracilis TaxID=219809 RepID=UPI00099499C2|nr:borealin [Pseudomyrmex gracilis]
MPRTKYHNKSKGTSDSKELDLMLQTFDRHVKLRISKMERETQADLKSFDTFVDVMISRLPQEIRQMTLGEILAYDCNEEKENQKRENQNNLVSSSVGSDIMPPPATKGKSKAGKRGTTISDDGYASEGTKLSTTSQNVKSQTLVSTTRRTRSATRASTAKAKLLEVNQKTVTKKKNDLNKFEMDNFKTPAAKHDHTMYDVVTPKVKPNTPLNVLRRPRQGEMVLSMQGSPLLVSAVVEEKTANINVPLADGNVMSLLPREGLRLSHIPALDPETMDQLQTLKNHIEKVMALK